MSEAVVFQIGAVIFVAVSAVVFLYGMSAFRDWEDDDDTRADDRLLDGAAEPIAPPPA